MSESSFEEQLSQHGKLVYYNVGTSMMPLLRQHRDLMVIEKRPEGRLKKYDAVLYKRGEKYILHRILRVTPTGYVICGDNCRKREFDITDENILGVLTAVVRDGKEIAVTDTGYRCYVHLWCDLFPLRAAVLYGRDALRAVRRRLKRALKRLT